MALTEPALPRAPHTDRRPWGEFHRYTLNESSTVKRITVAPGHRLSLQRHAHRDEWWVILTGELVTQVGEAHRTVTAGEQVWIPRGELHRVANETDAEGSFLEIAFGTFDEDDIERLDDDYARS